MLTYCLIYSLAIVEHHILVINFLCIHQGIELKSPDQLSFDYGIHGLYVTILLEGMVG